MSETRLYDAPFGALTLRQKPEYDLERALRGAVLRLRLTEPRRKRRTNNLEGTMYPNQHNYFASPAQGSTLNAGQFGSAFVLPPCRGCASKQQAHDAQTPGRPQRNILHLLAARLKGIVR
jgi:hypothetical protein